MPLDKLQLPEKQKIVLQRWLPTIEAIPEVDLIWLEGSLVDPKRANPGADIDLRVALQDVAYERLWESDRQPLTSGIGEHLMLLDLGFTRSLTKDEGIVAELGVLKTSQIKGKEIYEWEVLFSRLPDGQPDFHSLVNRSAAELWPESEELVPKFVWKETEITLANIANTPGPLYMQEWQSVHFIIAETRSSIVRIMYRLTGVAFAKRFKHLTQVLPAEYLADLDKTYLQAGADPLNPAAMIDTMLRLYEIKGQYLQLLSDKAGGGFEPEWYWRLMEQTKVRLNDCLASI